MKKILGIVVLGLMWCSVSISEVTYGKKTTLEELNKKRKQEKLDSCPGILRKGNDCKKINDFLSENYKLISTSKEEYNWDKYTLKKGKSLIVCLSRGEDTKCSKP